MDLSIERQLKELGINIEYCYLNDGDGYIFPTEHGPVLIIKEGLPEGRENEVAVHEIGHFLYDDEVTGSYCNSDRAHHLMESKANDNMLKYCLRSYIRKNDLTPDQVNPQAFCNAYNLPDNFIGRVAALLQQMMGRLIPA